MTDPESQKRAAAREARRWELFGQLERGEGDSQTIADELEGLSKEDDQYVGTLVNEIDVDHTLRREQGRIQIESLKAMLSAALPDGDPMKQTFIGLLDKLGAGEPLGPADLDAIRGLAGDEVADEMQRLEEEQQRLRQQPDEPA